MAPASTSRVASDRLECAPPAFRLRYFLVLLLVGLLASWIVPRGQAAWRLHNQAVLYADYALCMVGPTGPDLMLGDQAGFVELVRRRLVSSSPSEKPLIACQELSERLGVGHSAFRVHGASAAEFVEYKNSPRSRARATLGDLDLSLGHLDALAERAWPLVRGGASNLMVPSSHAKEAPHASAAPAAGRGTGLPGGTQLYRSTILSGNAYFAAFGSGANAQVLKSSDGGVHWSGARRGDAPSIRDRCVAGNEGSAFTVTRAADGRRVVVSEGPGADPQLAVLSDVDQEIAGISCDAAALVAALVQPKDGQGLRPVVLRLCPYRRACRDLLPPDMGPDNLVFPADVARIGGDIVVARAAGGITRVASSRDDGRSWTPWTVAHDTMIETDPLPGPFRLLVLGDQLVLYGGAIAGHEYALLVSLDHGASFRAPALTASPSPSRSAPRAARLSASLRP